VTDRLVKPLAWSLLGLWFFLLALDVVFELTGALDSGELVLALLTSGYAVVGALGATRQARNPIGWLMSALAIILVSNGLAAGYVQPVDDPLERFAGGLVVSYYHWNEDIWIPLVGVFLPLLFPDGRLPSPRWKPLLWAAVCGVSIGLVGSVFAPGVVDPDEWPGVANPFGLGGMAGRVMEALEYLGPVSFVIGVAGATAAVVVRFRRSRGEARQQLKWFAYAAGLLGASLLVAGAAVVAEESGAKETTWAYVIGAAGWFTALFAALLAMPVAIGLAVFRYRLYDIDVVINRTLVYGALTALLVGTYLGLVLLFQLALGPITEGNELGVAVSTLAVAALFRPVRRRVQAVVDRRFYRHKYDAARTLEAYSARLRDQVELEALATELRGIVAETMQPAHVSLWLPERTTFRNAPRHDPETIAG
jgi:hypothetical protein